MNLATAPDNQPVAQIPRSGRLNYSVKQWIPLVSLVVGSLILFLAYYKLRFAGLVNGDAFDFAQLGRNLTEGKGFVTYILRPLALTHSSDGAKQLDLTHGPLYPLILAIAYGALGATDSVTAYVSGLFYVLTVPIVYLIGMRSFGQRAGVIAAAVFAASTTMLDYSISGLPNPFYMFLVACLALAIHSVAVQSEETKAPVNGWLNRSGLIWVGLLTAALYLANPIFAWCLPIVGITVVSFFPARLRVHAGVIFCVSLLVVLPWMLRNYSLSGNPVFGLRGTETWMGTGIYPGYIGYRYLMNDTIAGKALFLGVAKKLVKQFFLGVQILPGTPFSLLLIFLIPSLLFRFSDAAANAVRRGAVAIFLGIFLGIEFFVMEPALLAVVAPVMLVFSAAFLLYLWDQAQLRGSTAIVAAALLSLPIVCSLANNFFLGNPSVAPVDKSAAMAFGTMVKKAHGSNVVLSDQPWIVAWYSGVPSIWIPAEASKIGALKSKFPGIHWVFLTQQARQYEPEWQRAYEVLARWNAIYEQAAVSGQYPPNIQLTEMIPSLSGFQSVPPASRGAAVSGIATDIDLRALQTTAAGVALPRTP